MTDEDRHVSGCSPLLRCTDIWHSIPATPDKIGIQSNLRFSAFGFRDDEFGLGNQRTGDADALTLTADT